MFDSIFIMLYVCPLLIAVVDAVLFSAKRLSYVPNKILTEHGMPEIKNPGALVLLMLMLIAITPGLNIRSAWRAISRALNYKGKETK